MQPQQVQQNEMYQQRFNAIDVDHSGFITSEELAGAFSQFGLKPQGAQILIRACTDYPTVVMQTYPILDYQINRIWTVFNQVASQTQMKMGMYQAQQALNLLQIPIKQDSLKSLYQKFAQKDNYLQFGDFASVVGVVMLTQKIFSKFDVQKKGQLVLNFDGVLNLGLWFI